MTVTIRFAAPALAMLLLAVAHPAMPAGYVDMSAAIAGHPLREVLAQYDRQIAALQRTCNVSVVSDAAAQANNAASALKRDAAAARLEVQRIASRSGAAADSNRERAALAQVSARLPASGFDAYTQALNRETASNLAAYARGIAQRSARALAARREQLREKELTLAFDLERQDAGKRLELRLKLTDLHLAPSERAKLQATLDTVERQEFAAVAARRTADATVLASYANSLQRNAVAANAAMVQQLRGKSAANLALRRTIAPIDSTAAALRSQGAAFAARDDVAGEGRTIALGMQAAGDHLAKRFAQLAATDRESSLQIAARIAALKRERDAVYRAMVAQITRTAQQVARARHVGSVTLAGARPKGSVDLTGAVKATLAAF
jgi:hypothetical protein